MINYIINHLKNNYKINSDEFVIIAPDAGATKRAFSLASKLKLPTMIMHKERNYDIPNQINNTILVGKREYIINKTAIIIDDICDTFGTINSAGAVLLDHGAKEVICVVTHGIFSNPAIERINNNSFISKIITTNTIPQHINITLSDKIEVIDISELIANTISIIVLGGSVSNLF